MALRKPKMPGLGRGMKAPKLGLGRRRGGRKRF